METKLCPHHISENLEKITLFSPKKATKGEENLFRVVVISVSNLQEHSNLKTLRKQNDPRQEKKKNMKPKTYIYAIEVLLFIHSHNLSFLHCHKKKKKKWIRTFSLFFKLSDLFQSEA
jgi:hypothetical protein